MSVTKHSSICTDFAMCVIVRTGLSVTELAK